MNNKKLIVLAVIVVALLLVGIVSKKKQTKTMVDMARLEKILPDGIKKESVTRIEIVVPEGRKDDSGAKNSEEKLIRKLTLLKKGDGWIIPEVFDVEVKKDVIDKLMETLFSVSGEFRSDVKEVLSDYVLDDKSALEISIYSKGEKPEAVVLVGKDAGYKTQFVRLKGSDRVFSIDKNLRDEVGASTDDLQKPSDYKHFVDLKIFKGGRDNLKTIALKYGGTVELAFNKEEVEETIEGSSGAGNSGAETKKVTRWVVTRPDDLPFKLKEKGVDEILRMLNGLNAEDVVAKNDDDGKKSFFLDKEALVNISYETADGKKGEIVAVKSTDDGGFYNAFSTEKGNIYKLEGDSIERVFFKSEGVFDLNVLKLSEAEVEEIVASGEYPYTLTHDLEKNTWNFASPKVTEMEDLKVKDIVNAFTTLNAHGFVTKKESFDNPLYSAVIKLKDGSVFRVNIGGEAMKVGDKFVSQISGVNYPVLLQKHKVESLFPELVGKDENDKP